MSEAPPSPGEGAAPAAPPSTEPTPAPAPEERAARIALGVTLSLALIGLVTGMWQAERAPTEREAALAPQTEPPVLIKRAPKYKDLAGGALSVNARWSTDLRSLDAPLHDRLALRDKPSEAERAAALKVRAARRAYAGAPPIVPHQISSRRADDCLACHEQGTRVADRVAPPLPHAAYANCLQCHAPPPPSALADAPVGTGPNTFKGRAEVAAGSRAGPGAPPVIPHATKMRSECLACHGPSGAQPGIRTSHPWRVNCRQCHAAGAGYAK